ncbi:hypothetical protein [Pseudomonas alabamensis]|uniref:hypothetical protein n=1 Tax=Pseudomonas alabamensis TaxID=3064349 RepID=UPI003F64FE0F
MKPVQRSLKTFFSSSILGFILMGCIAGGCASFFIYEWVDALLSGVHVIHVRGRPTKVLTLDGSAGAYWLSMLFEALRIALLVGAAWLSFFAARLCRK